MANVYQTKIGLSVVDATTALSPIIEPADFTSLGVQIMSARGALNKTRRVNSFLQLQNLFGEVRNGENGVLVLRELFKNADPYSVNAHVARVGTGGTAATSSILTGSTKFVLAPSQTPVTATVNIAAGSILDTLTLTIVGTVNSVSVTETYTDISMSDIASAINDGAGSYQQSKMVRVAYIGGDITVLTGSKSVSSVTGAVYDGTISSVLSAGQFGDPDPGKWANSYGYEVVVDVNNPYKRALNVYKFIQGTPVKQEPSVTGIDIDNQENKINGECPWIRCVLANNSGLLDPTGEIVRLNGGVDPTAPTLNDFVGTSVASTGLYAFTTTAISTFMYVEDVLDDADKLDFMREVDTFLDGNMPQTIGLFNIDANSLQAVIAGGWNSLIRKKSYIATYLGYLKVADGKGGIRTIPSLGSIYGSGFIKKMMNAPLAQGGQLPIIAPAGHGAALKGAKSITTPILSDADLLYLTKELGINAVQDIPEVGISPRTSRLMSSDNIHYDIHKRRALNFIANSFRNSLGWIEQEPHTPDTWNKLITVMRGFLLDLYNRGMFNKNGGFDGAVRIKCDAENNPPQQVAQRILLCEVTVWIVNVIETAYIAIRNVELGPINVDFEQQAQ